MNTREYCEGKGIRVIKAIRVVENPHLAHDRDWSADGSHWHVVLAYRSRTTHRLRKIETFHTIGSSTDAPDVADILDVMASDAKAFDDHGAFEEFAAAYQLNPDSRKAEHYWRYVGDSAERLCRWLGPEEYRNLLYYVERL